MHKGSTLLLAGLAGLGLTMGGLPAGAQDFPAKRSS